MRNANAITVHTSETMRDTLVAWGRHYTRTPEKQAEHLLKIGLLVCQELHVSGLDEVRAALAGRNRFQVVVNGGTVRLCQ